MTEDAATPDAETPEAVAESGRLPLQGVVLIVLLAFIWGINWPSMRAVVVEISPWTFRAICLSAGAATLFAVSLVRGQRLSVPRGEILPLIAVGLLNVTAYHLLSAFGLSMMSAGRGVILGFTFPLWSVLMGRVVLGEPLTGSRVAALLLGLAAMALLLGPGIIGLGSTPWGGLLLIGSAVSWAAATMCFKYFKWTLASGELAAWQVLIGGVPVIIGALILAPPFEFSGVSATALVGLVYSSAVAVSFGQWIWFRVLEILPTAVASISTLAIPVIGVFSGALLLGEVIGWRELAALALVSAALAIVLVGRPGWEALRRLGR